MTKRITILGTGGAGQGYSGMIEQTIVALDRLKDVDVHSVSFSKAPSANISEEYKKIRSKPFVLGDVSLAIGFPSAATSNEFGKFRVLSTMFETDKLPTGKEWAGIGGNAPELINNTCDLLVVPCNHNAKLFRDSGVKIPIEVVPCGINPNLFPYVERKPKPDHKFTFFMYGTLTLRKNPGMVISAFASLFKDNPNVRLVLKTQSATLGHVEYVDMGDITVVDTLWTVETLYRALEDADCMVFPTRGEGFGIPPLEAMATGLPTIIADNTGMSDYANPDYNLAVPTKSIVPAQRYPQKWGDVGNWYDPDYDDLKAKMKWVYENQPEAKAMGIRASKWVHDNWTYDNTAVKLVEAIKKHYKGWQNEV
jgi:glycosyltransferase involved in cell wall biosynthesis